MLRGPPALLVIVDDGWRRGRTEGRWRGCVVDAFLARNKVSLAIFWLRVANRHRVTVAPRPSGALLRCRGVVVGTTVGQGPACQLFFAELGGLLQR